MQKTANGSRPVWLRHRYLKTLLTSILLLSATLQVSAKGKGQESIVGSSDRQLELNETFDVKKTHPPIDVKGRIVNEKGEPIVGVSVVVKGTRKGTTTNLNGEFTIENVEEGSSLVITSVGYEETTIKVGKSSIAVSLKKTDTQLQDVVISTGYSNRKIGEITGSVQRISGEDLRRGVTSADPASLLKGRTTGLYITEQNAGDPTSVSQIFVRGQSSIAGVGVDQINEFVMPSLNYGPLLVLDGVIMPNQNLRDLVTPQEIETLTILKDASATAIYGSRAAAGVLVVTTKKGRADKPRVSAELKYGINVPNRAGMHFMNGRELHGFMTEYFTQNYQMTPALATTYPTLEAYLSNRLPTLDEALSNEFNWYDVIFRTTNTKEANVSVSGGTDRSRYYIGVGYYNELSTGISNALTRKSFRLNLDNRLSDRVKLNVSMNALINDGKTDPENAIGFMYDLVPWANPYGPGGVITPSIQYKVNGALRTITNPLFNEMYNYRTSNANLFFGSVRLDVKITDWLNFSSTNSGNLNFNKNITYIDARTHGGGGTANSPQGYLGTSTNNLSNYLTSNQLSFSKNIGQHGLKALAGVEFGKTETENMTLNVNGVRPGYPVISLGRQVGGNNANATRPGNAEGGRDERAAFSAFGEAGYTYNDKYTLSASLRTDASSSFGPDERYGTFYSVGGAWVVTKETFMKSAKAVSNLKLRASYGTSGSQLGDNFLTRTLYNPNGQYAGLTASNISVLGNPDLRWEVTKTLNTGFDLSLFKVIDLTVDYYDRKSEDLLQKVELPSLVGFSTQWRNVATVQNRGIELMINSTNISRNGFHWSTSFNVTYNRNKLLKVANDSLPQGFGREFYLYPGEDINTLKAVKYAGVDPQTGKPLFEKLLFDAKGNVTGVTLVNTVAETNPRVDTRQNQVIGSFQPKYFGGLTNNFSYKSFSLSVMVTYALDYFMNNRLSSQRQGRNVTTTNQVRYREKQVRWTTPGQTGATEPWLYHTNNTNWAGSSKYYIDASNVSLRNVRLSYDLSKALLSKMKISNCTFYVSGDNLYAVYSKNLLASSAEGPSVGQAQNYGTASFGVGIPRRYVFGLQLTF